MAISKCPKCESSQFEVKQNSPTYSQFKLYFVQCSSCGAVVGAMDFYNIGARISELEKKIEEIKYSSSVNHNLDAVNNNISRIFNFLKSKLGN